MKMAGSSRQKLVELDTKLAYIPAKYHYNIITVNQRLSIDLAAEAEVAKVEPKKILSRSEPNFS